MAAPQPDLARRLMVPALSLLLLVLGIAAGMLTASSRVPKDDSAEAGFARDMATHHAQAVDMSFAVLDNAGDEGVRTIAADIIVTQSTQRGVFMGWLQQWGLPQASARPRMAWMPGHSQAMPASGGALMHGMATDAEIQQLRDAHGVAAETLFLQLMIRHHEGGIIMARALMSLTKRAEVTQMVKSIDEGQRAEIAQMKAMLNARGAQPLPSILE